MRGKYESPLPKNFALTAAAFALSRVYAGAVGARNFAYDKFRAMSHDLGRPTISIGGIRAGGVGKTPVAQMIGRYLADECDCTVAFLSRGYGRSSSSTKIVAPHEKVDWQDVGDEPWMLHRNIPESWLGIDADRVRAAALIAPQLPARAAFILDDGFQYRRARRGLDIVCLSESAFDDKPLPRGYLREPTAALARADAVLVIGAKGREDALARVKTRVAEHCGKIGGRLKFCAVLLQKADGWIEARSNNISKKPPFSSPVAVCGIARPERFLEMLRAQGVVPKIVRAYKDHHKYKICDFDFGRDVYSYGLVTTEKDAVRMVGFAPEVLPEIWYLRMGLRFADDRDEAKFWSMIRDVIVQGDCGSSPQ